MDLYAIINALRTEAKRLDCVIAHLAQLERKADTSAPPSRRGRKSMGLEERQIVAARMKRYWANRKKTRTETA